MSEMPWVAIVTVLSLAAYLVTGVNVARVRVKHKVYAPAMTGHPEFERAMRVQMNTLEWLPVYLAALWLCAYFAHPWLAAAVGLVWIVGRALYMQGYMRAADKRGPGFLIQASATFVLLVAAFVGSVMKLIADAG
jgi:glutathione S-transferase